MPLTDYEGEPISSTDNMAAEGDYQWQLEKYGLDLEYRSYVLAWNAANPSQQKPVPPVPTRPAVPTRPVPRPHPAPIDPIPIWA